MTQMLTVGALGNDITATTPVWLPAASSASSETSSRRTLSSLCSMALVLSFISLSPRSACWLSIIEVYLGAGAQCPLLGVERTWLPHRMAFQTRQKAARQAWRQSPRRPPATALLLYQRAAPAWNGRIVLRVKL